VGFDVRARQLGLVVKLLVALALALGVTLAPYCVPMTAADRAALGCSQVRELNGGPVALVKYFRCCFGAIAAGPPLLRQFVEQRHRFID
jgi:hypothetical protein